MKIFTANKFYECYKCRGQILKGETYVRYAIGATAHERCYDTTKEPFALNLTDTAQERKRMNTHLYTLNEITDALRHLAAEEDSITELLKRGSFRKQFDQYIADHRTKRSAGEVSTLHDRLVSTTVDGTEVYLLDDIQGALSKPQFAEFMTFLRYHHIETSIDDESYVPVTIVDSFITDTLQQAVPEAPEISLLRIA